MPYIGSVGEIDREPELKVEVTIRAKRIDETIAAIKRIYPYEDPIINAIPLWRTSFYGTCYDVNFEYPETLCLIVFVSLTVWVMRAPL